MGLYYPQALLKKKYLAEMNNSGFNIILTQLSGGKTAKLILDMAEETNLKVMGYGTLWDISKNRKNVINAMANPFIYEHPNFVGWYFPDEPAWEERGEGGAVSLESLIDSYEVFKKVDPYHIVWMLHAPRGEINYLSSYNQAADITGCDIYTVPEESNSHSNLPNRTLSCVGDYTEKMRATVKDEKPVWMVLQGFGWGDLSSNPSQEQRRPNWTETRFMAYDSIIHRARGIFYWGVSYVPLEDELWVSLKKIATELSTLSPVLLQPDINEHNFLIEPKNSSIEILVKNYDGETYIIAANSKKESVKIKLKGFPRELDKINVIFENRAIPLKKGEFEDNFSGYEVHIYTTSSKPLPNSIKKIDLSKINEEGKITQLNRDVLQNPAIVGFDNWKANWIWYPGEYETPNLTIYGGKNINIQELENVKEGWVVITADNHYHFFINGKLVGEDWEEVRGGWPCAESYDILSFLRKGENLFTFEAKNDDGPAGVLIEGKIVMENNESIDIISNESWLLSKVKEEKWPQFISNNSNWVKPELHGTPPVSPWGVLIIEGI